MVTSAHIDIDANNAHRACNAHNALNVAFLTVYFNISNFAWLWQWHVLKFSCPRFSCPVLLKFERGLHVTEMSLWFRHISIYLAIRVVGIYTKGSHLTFAALVRIQTFELNEWTIQPLIPWSPGSFTRPAKDEKKARIYGTWFVDRMLVDVDLLRAGFYYFYFLLATFDTPHAKRHATQKCLSSHAAAKVSKDLRRLAKRLQENPQKMKHCKFFQFFSIFSHG